MRRMQRCLMAEAVLLALLIGLSGVLVAQGQDTTEAKPTPPSPLESGPGSPATPYPEAVWTHYGADPGGFWVIEPSMTADAVTLPEGTGPMPLVVFIAGCCDEQTQLAGVSFFESWVSHVSRQGMVVISPVYSPPKADYDPLGTVPEIQQLVRDALAELTGPGHPAIDTGRSGVIAASFGGIPGIVYASQAESIGLPVPRGLFVHAPCEDYCGIRVPPETTMPAGLKVVELSFERDEYMPLETQKRVFETFLSLPQEDRDFVRMYRDDHGDPPVEAGHAEGGNEPDTGEYYGVWKLSTALMTCAIDDVWCEYALGDTPEQRSMGTWSDGVPVEELLVIDDPIDLGSY